MKQILVIEPGKLATIEQPDPVVGPGEIKLRIRLSGLSSRSEIERYARNPAGKPEPIGYNVVGEVEALGDAVTTFSVGDRVFSTASHADVAVVDARLVFKIPDEVDDASACFAYLPTLGTHALRLAGYQPGEFVGIVGQGIIGQTAARVARLYGARTIAVDLSDDRLELAKQAGVDLTINPAHQDAGALIADFCGQAGLDIVIETASSWRSLSQSLDLIRPRGRVVLLGIIRDAPTDRDAAAFFDAYRRNVHRKEAVVIGASNDASDPDGSTGARFTRERNIEEVLYQIAQGALDFKSLITHRYPTSELESIYQLLLNGGGQDHLGVVFTWPSAGGNA